MTQSIQKNKQIELLSIFKNRSVIVTGHTGFKGSWLVAWLLHLGARVTGVSKDVPTDPSHYEACQFEDSLHDIRLDILDQKALESIVHKTEPDFVFHLAAQTLVRHSYLDPVKTYQTNMLGTLHILEALRRLNKNCIAVLITSDKCYDNVEWPWGYKETDRLGGPDPYSASKGAAELVIHSHLKSFFPPESKIRIGIGRAGNVIGGGDWAVDRIVPDCVRCWADGKTVVIRNPKAVRPWQHVLEPLYGYLTLAKRLHLGPELHGEPFNFGPPSHQNYSVRELAISMSKYWPRLQWEEGSNNNNAPYESGLLKLNCDKALYHLGWKSELSFQETVRMTAEWYRAYYDNPLVILEKTLDQICEYENLLQTMEQACIK